MSEPERASGDSEPASFERRVADAAEGARAAADGAPLVAVAIAARNPPIELLEALVESLKDQDHRGWICAISDDRSAAESVGATRDLLGDDRRFVLSSSAERLGRDASFERALAAIGEAADLVALADQSDLWRQSKLSRLIEALGSDAALAYSDMRVLGPDRRAVADRFAPPPQPDDPLTTADVTSRHVVPGSAMLFRRQLLELALPFPAELGLRLDQWLAAVALATGELAFVDAPLTDHCAVDPDRARELARAAADGRGGEKRQPRWRRAFGRGGPAAAEIEAILDRRQRRAAGAVQPLGRQNAERHGSLPIGSDLAISVQGVSKSFAVPAPRPETIGGRLRHPLSRLHTEKLAALEEISFEVARGEFFGITGGNGSGKTTLLQILASVYAADTGRVLIAPRVAPIISLGIGFQQEMGALANVLMTAELLGVRASVVRSRFDELLAFAGLEDFANLKLRNYSSGMRVRLAFATVMLVDADVLLLDEVLAVGDAVFRDRATKAFEELRANKTVVLVTHNVSHLQNYCDRAMLLDRGRMDLVGSPDEVTRRYAELTLEQHGESTDLPLGTQVAAAANPRAQIADLWIADAREQRATSVAFGEEIVLHAELEATAAVREPGLRFEIRRRGGARIFAPPTLWLGERARRMRPGASLKVETAIENKLAPGPYTCICTVTANREGGERSVSAARTLDFVVAAGAAEIHGMVDLEHSVKVEGRPGRGRGRAGSRAGLR